MGNEWKEKEKRQGKQRIVKEKIGKGKVDGRDKEGTEKVRGGTEEMGKKNE